MRHILSILTKNEAGVISRVSNLFSGRGYSIESITASTTLDKEHSKIKMPKIKKRNVSAWIKKVVELHGKKVGDLSYLFCSDDHILEVNKEYLQHDYYTDILSFQQMS